MAGALVEVRKVEVVTTRDRVWASCQALMVALNAAETKFRAGEAASNLSVGGTNAALTANAFAVFLAACGIGPNRPEFASTQRLVGYLHDLQHGKMPEALVPAAAWKGTTDAAGRIKAFASRYIDAALKAEPSLRLEQMARLVAEQIAFRWPGTQWGEVVRWRSACRASKPPAPAAMKHWYELPLPQFDALTPTDRANSLFLMLRQAVLQEPPIARE